jgi:transposase
LFRRSRAGMTLKAAAAAFSVSPATAHRWWHRWLDASEEARTTLSCLYDRPSRPRRSPRQLAPELAEAICECRRTTGWGPRLVAGATGFGHSTVSKVLTRAGISRPPRPVREPANRLLVEVLIPPSCVNEIFPVRESRLGLSSGWCRCSLFVTRFSNDPVGGCLSSDLSGRRGRYRSGVRLLADATTV